MLIIKKFRWNTSKKERIIYGYSTNFKPSKKSFYRWGNRKTHKNIKFESNVVVEENISNNIENETKKSAFIESIKNIEDEETKLLKLQKQYRSGEIKEEELTQEQVNSLCALYDKQIANLKKSNEMRKQKLLEYRRKLQAE